MSRRRATRANKTDPSAPAPAPAPAPVAPDDLRHRAPTIVALALPLLTLAVFWPLIHCDFVTYDDWPYVFQNPHVQQGLTADSITWAFTTFELANWHPLQWLSFQLDYELYGLDPGGFHFTNVMLHAANASLLFWVLWTLTRNIAPAAIAAALFALHSLHVESTAWISERKDLLSTLFGLLALLAYARFAHQGGGARLLLVALCQTLSLLAKPMLVTLPCVLLLLDYWPLKRLSRFAWHDLRPLLIEKLPLFALSIASGIVAIAAQQHGGSISGLEAVPLGHRLTNAVAAYGLYLWNTAWPRDLAVLYLYAPLRWSQPQVWVSALVLIAVSIIAVRQARQWPSLLVGWLWFLGTLLPVIGLLQVGEQSRADRYTYVPLIGVFIAIAWLLRDVAARSRAARSLTVIAAAAALLACAWQSRRQLEVWRNSETLWTHAIDVTGPNASSLFGRATYYRDTNQHARAVDDLRRGLEFNPHYDLARLSLGYSLLVLGRLAEAGAEFSSVLPHDPDDADQLLDFARRAEDPAYALAYYTRALNLRPDDVQAHLELANRLLQLQQPAPALRHFRRAAALQPELLADPDFQRTLGALEAAGIDPRDSE